MGEESKLIWGLKTGDMELVQARLQTEADVNRTLDGGRKALHYAADFGQKELVDYLIALGADINALDKHGISPLLIATYESHRSVVETLVAKGADKERKGPDGKRAIEATESEEIKALLK